MGDDSEKDVLSVVELTPKTSRTSNFFLEVASSWSLFASIIMISAFPVVHLVAAWSPPSRLLEKQEFHQVNITGDNSSYSVDMIVSELHPFPDILTLSFSLALLPVSHSRNLRAGVVLHATHLQDENVPVRRVDDSQFLIVNVARGAGRSPVHDLLQAVIRDTNAFHVHLDIRTNYSAVQGFYFNWAFSDMNDEKFCKRARFWLSGLIGFMFLLAVANLNFDSESWTQSFLIILGIVGVLASNPIQHFFFSDGSLQVMDHALMASFNGIYRMFMIIQLELLRTHKVIPDLRFLIGCVVVFTSYAGIEFAAMDERSGKSPSVLMMENSLMFAGILYTLVSLAYTAVTVVTNNGVNVRKVCFFSVSVIVTSFTTFLTDVYFVWRGQHVNSVFPQMVSAAVHMSLAAMTIFLLHSAGGPEYEDLEWRRGSVVLDIERESDHGENEESDDST
jgi:hypothetical protein